jgi:hypothetical protein
VSVTDSAETLVWAWAKGRDLARVTRRVLIGRPFVAPYDPGAPPHPEPAEEPARA